MKEVVWGLKLATSMVMLKEQYLVQKRDKEMEETSGLSKDVW